MAGRIRLASALLALGVLAAVSAGPRASAQVIDIDGPEIEKGEREVKNLNTFNGRYRAGAAGNPRSSHELGAGYSPLEYFKISAHVEIDNVAEESWRLEHAAVKTFVELKRAGEKGGLGLGWHTGLQAAVHQDATNAVVFGPIVKLAFERAALTFNPYFEKTFGQNREPGVAFLYGWQARLDLRKGFGIGVEGVGTVDDIGNAPPWSEQDHRIGPGVFFEWEAGKDRAIVLDAAVFFGLTEAAPATSLKLNVGTKF